MIKSKIVLIYQTLICLLPSFEFLAKLVTFDYHVHDPLVSHCEEGTVSPRRKCGYSLQQDNALYLGSPMHLNIYAFTVSQDGKHMSRISSSCFPWFFIKMLKPCFGPITKPGIRGLSQQKGATADFYPSMSR